jgi:peptide/nickel transport system permease protein
MLSYIIRRLLLMVPAMIILSFICFVVINAAPGDFVDTYKAKLMVRDMNSEQRTAQLKFVDTMRQAYGLDQPLLTQYGIWVWKIVTRGDFGYSFSAGRPVGELIWEKLGWTLLLAGLSMIVTLFVGIVVGLYSAVHQYSVLDRTFSFLSFLGLSIPTFFLALLLMALLVFTFNVQSVTGLHSSQYATASLSWGKFLDLLQHLWLPVFVIAAAGTASNVRIVRANILDILKQPYIQTARAKGLRERVVTYRHALRNSLHPMIMIVGSSLPGLISGETITSIVLGLPTVGYTFYVALKEQDIYLAGTFLLLSALLLQVGNLLADIALVYVDPTISYD